MNRENNWSNESSSVSYKKQVFLFVNCWCHLAAESERLGQDSLCISLPDIWDMSASEVSPFHGIALYHNYNYNRRLLTYLLKVSESKKVRKAKRYLSSRGRRMRRRTTRSGLHRRQRRRIAHLGIGNHRSSSRYLVGDFHLATTFLREYLAELTNVPAPFKTTSHQLKSYW